jgi:hypothetical protein
LWLLTRESKRAMSCDTAKWDEWPLPSPRQRVYYILANRLDRRKDATTELVVYDKDDSNSTTVKTFRAPIFLCPLMGARFLLLVGCERFTGTVLIVVPLRRPPRSSRHCITECLVLTPLLFKFSLFA